MVDKQSLLSILENEEHEENALIAGLSDQERRAIGTPAKWSARDLIAHINAWKLKLGQNLLALSEGRSGREPDEDDVENARTYENFQTRDWSEIIEFARAANSLLREQVGQLNDRALENRGGFPWEGDRPLWRVIAGTAYIHPNLHITAFSRENNHPDLADTVSEHMARDLMTLDSSPDWRGLVVYNLACHYSLSGETEKALDSLEKAFSLYPDIKDWARQDTDLDPIRDEPAFNSFIQD
jgi:tetratricopeptide (TPR) repeat protein